MNVCNNNMLSACVNQLFIPNGLTLENWIGSKDKFHKRQNNCVEPTVNLPWTTGRIAWKILKKVFFERRPGSWSGDSVHFICKIMAWLGEKTGSRTAKFMGLQELTKQHYRPLLTTFPTCTFLTFGQTLWSPEQLVRWTTSIILFLTQMTPRLELSWQKLNHSNNLWRGLSYLLCLKKSMEQLRILLVRFYVRYWLHLLLTSGTERYQRWLNRGHI